MTSKDRFFRRFLFLILILLERLQYWQIHNPLSSTKLISNKITNARRYPTVCEWWRRGVARSSPFSDTAVLRPHKRQTF